jgi:signal transduction histidine kinase
MRGDSPGEFAYSLEDRALVARTSPLRHGALSLAALAAYALRRELHVSTVVVWILATTAAANAIFSIASQRGPRASTPDRLAPIVAVAGWAVLVASTGAAASPFVLGFWIEILLAAMNASPRRIASVTGLAIVALWVQELVSGARADSLRLVVETAFLLFAAVLTMRSSTRGARARSRLASRTRDLREELRAARTELDAARALGRVGERAARAAHSLKSAAHSVRGFSRLVEAGGNADRRALEGLRDALDRLEARTRDLLAPNVTEMRPPCCSPEDVRRAVGNVIEEIGPMHATIRWVEPSADDLPSLAVPASAFREVLAVLVENAAEACRDQGMVTLSAEVVRGMFRLSVHDEGPGLAPDFRADLFSPGATTKASGNGYGLFLARRLLEARGGQLVAETATGRGAVFRATFPVQERGAD